MPLVSDLDEQVLWGKHQDGDSGEDNGGGANADEGILGDDM